MESFLKSIGVADDLLQHLDKVSLAFQRPAIFWFGLLLLIPVGYYIFRRQRDNLATVPQSYRIALSVTRLVILVILVAVLSGPYLKLDHTILKKPIFAVLFDKSQSMQLPAGPFESDEQRSTVAAAAGFKTRDGAIPAETIAAVDKLDRAQLADRVVRASYETLLKPIEEEFELQYYQFARDISPLTFQEVGQKPVAKSASASHLGDAVYHVLEESRGRQVAGVLLLSDGENTGGRSPALAARAAADAQAPVFVTPLGSQQRLQDVALVDVYTSGLVAVGDKVQVHATLESQGFDGRPVKIELKDGEQLLDTKEVVVQDAEQKQIELSFEAKQPGVRYLTVSVAPQPEETEQMRANNADTALVRISEEKIRVLLLDGLPRWDFRFLKNAIRRDHGLAGREAEVPDVVVETEWRRQSPEQRQAALPRSLEEMAKYHTIILGDASPQILDDQFRGLLSLAVREKGVGLIVATGTQAMPHAFDQAFLDLLPVRLEPGQAGQEAAVYNPFHLEVTPDGVLHETLRLYDDPGRNQDVWAQMPPYYWCAALERPAPGATVLAWNPNVEGRFGKLPLIAHHYAGDGKVLLVGTDSTWLWRQNVGDRFFYKFWGQAIRFVARPEESAKKNRLEVRPVRAQPGEDAQIELLAFQADGKPEESPTRIVTVLGPVTRENVELVADQNKSGRYTGSFAPEEPGVYRIAYQPSDGSGPVEASIRVLIPPEEFRHPNLNRPALEMLASTSGGRVVEVSDLKSIREHLQGKTEQTELHREATVWDNWLVLLVLVATYSIDVGIRRLLGLL